MLRCPTTCAMPASRDSWQTKLSASHLRGNPRRVNQPETVLLLAGPPRSLAAIRVFAEGARKPVLRAVFAVISEWSGAETAAETDLRRLFGFYLRCRYSGPDRWLSPSESLTQRSGDFQGWSASELPEAQRLRLAVPIAGNLGHAQQSFGSEVDGLPALQDCIDNAGCEECQR